MMKQKAFTMIELVLVIVVLGILAALAIPRLERDLRQEAADNILSSIRYTQHLALLDNKQMFNNPRWQRRFWRIMFAPCSDGKYFYRIGSDNDMDSTSTFERSEAALDPSDGKPMYMDNNGDCSDSSVSRNIMIGKKYGVVVNAGTGGCAGVRSIGFDHLGRPHIGFSNSNTPDYSSYIDTACQLNFTMSDGSASFSITIEPETGFTYISDQAGS
jgi:prepilin-type N-terminal cleavage/methylation domain-containing protein